MESAAEWVEVRSFTWLHEAEFVKSLLIAHGIEAIIPNAHTLGIQPLYAPALGGVRVLVRAADFDRALEVIDSHEEPK